MITVRIAAVALVATAVSSCARSAAERPPPRAESRVIAAEAGETHLTNIRQLTYGGENAEAYFSPDGAWLIVQSTRDGPGTRAASAGGCDQQ